MLELFSQMTVGWFNRAYVYTGSVGPSFRFRYEQAQTEDGQHILRGAVYSGICYELAQDVRRQDFPWDEAGGEALKQWYQAQYEAFSAGK